MPLDITEAALAATLDHAILKPDFTRADVDAELETAALWRVFSVCVRPSDIPYAVARLEGTGVAVVVETAGGLITKVILETSLLDDEQIARGSRLTEAGGADFVKTSTGFAGGGATVPHVELMRASVGPEVQVKASGGVRGLDTALEMLDAGATRLGTSASATILGELRARLSGSETSATVDESSY